VALDSGGQVSFRWKDYRDGRGRTKPKVMHLPAGEFMRRFLLHVLPEGFHRIRHYGLFANGHRAAMVARCRELLGVPPAPAEADDQEERRGATKEVPACPCCGGPMRVIERFEGPGSRRRYPGRKPDDGW
jgi:Putative transposase